jgi:hypothetical protein
LSFKRQQSGISLANIPNHDKHGVGLHRADLGRKARGSNRNAEDFHTSLSKNSIDVRVPKKSSMVSKYSENGTDAQLKHGLDQNGLKSTQHVTSNDEVHIPLENVMKQFRKSNSEILVDIEAKSVTLPKVPASPTRIMHRPPLSIGGDDTHPNHSGSKRIRKQITYSSPSKRAGNSVPRQQNLDKLNNLMYEEKDPNSSGIPADKARQDLGASPTNNSLSRGTYMSPIGGLDRYPKPKRVGSFPSDKNSDLSA